MSGGVYVTKGIVQGLYVGIRAEPNEYAEAFIEERLEEFGTPVEADIYSYA
jgi:hypothetical protein